MVLHTKFDRKADAVYVYFSDKPVAYTKQLDDMRYVDYASDDTPIGVELLSVSDGVIADDLPYEDEIIRVLEDRKIKVFA